MKRGTSLFNRAIPWILSFFLILEILPSFSYPDSTLYDLLHQANVYPIYRLVVGVLFIGVALIVWRQNKGDPPLRYELMFLWLLVYLLLVAFIHERSLSYLDDQGITQIFHLSWSSFLNYEAGVLYDLFFAFSFLFLWPYQKRAPKDKNVVLYLALILGVVSVIYAFIKGPDNSSSYLVYTSFYKSNEDFGKILFAGAFCSSVLAIEKRGAFRIGLFGVSFALSLSAWFLALGLTFWALFGANLIIAFAILNSSKGALAGKVYRFLALGYLLLATVFLLMVAIPSPIATYLRLNFAEEFTAVFSNRSDRWSSFLNALSSWRLFFGDGALGYYRSALLAGQGALYQPLNGGIMEIYNDGGIIALLFYLLVIVVALSRFKKEESHHPAFFAIVLSFTAAFFLYTVLSSERLLFSSNYLSFIVAYLFMCYPRYKDPGEE